MCCVGVYEDSIAEIVITNNSFTWTRIFHAFKYNNSMKSVVINYQNVSFPTQHFKFYEYTNELPCIYLWRFMALHKLSLFA